MALRFTHARASRHAAMLSAGSRGSDGRDAAARLVAAVSPLWPGATLAVRRVGPSSGRSWLVLPSLSRPILLVPPRSAAAAAALQPTGTGRSQLPMRALALLQRHRLLRLLPLPRLVVTGAPGPDAVEGLLRDALGPVDDLVVRLGRRRFNRALVLLPFGDGGRLLGVVKVARGAAPRRVLRQEHDTLVKAHERHVPGLRVPAPMLYAERGDLGYFAMSPLTSTELSRPRPVPVRQMRALAELGRGPSLPLRSTRAVERLRRRVATLEDLEQRAWTRAALETLLWQLGEVEVPQGAWHGDFVPWNMAREGDDVLLWDWEHFDLEALSAWDHLHYLAQDLRMRVGTTPQVEDTWLAEAEHALAGDWHLDDERQRQAVLRAYLLEINLRYLHDRQEDPLGTPGRAGWARDLVERLGAGSGRTTVAGTTGDTRTA